MMAKIRGATVNFMAQHMAVWDFFDMKKMAVWWQRIPVFGVLVSAATRLRFQGMLMTADFSAS